MTALATTSSFPVTYVQEHVHEMPRSKWAMLTGLPQSATSQELVDAYVAVVRKSLGRGQHIPQILVWTPDPAKYDYPSKEDASLMDEIAQADHETIPIEVAEVSEDDGVIRGIYRVLVSEERLVEEQLRREGQSGELPKTAGLQPTGVFFLGAILTGGLSAMILGKHVSTGMRLFVGSAVGVLGGVFAVQLANRTTEGESDEQATT